MKLNRGAMDFYGKSTRPKTILFVPYFTMLKENNMP